MAMNLRGAIVRNTGTTAVVCFVLSIGLSWLTGSLASGSQGLAWPIALAIGIGLFTGWRVMVNIKQGVLRAIPVNFSLVRVERGAEPAGVVIDWNTIDDYGVQLEQQGFRPVGEYLPYPLPAQFTGVAACFLNRDETIMVEVQHILLSEGAAQAVPSTTGGVHFSLASLVGGTIRVNTTDHTPMASNFLVRGKYDVVSAHPGAGLLDLLDKHRQLLDRLFERTGKPVSRGLTMPRYVQAIRNAFADARGRIQSMSGYQIATLVDEFESAPVDRWSPPSEVLAAAPDKSLEELDRDAAAQSQPAVLDMDAASAQQLAAGPSAAAAEAGPLQSQVESGANWFYWIAGLSLVNCVVAVLGSDWGFAIGLGISQILIAVAGSLAQDGMSSLAVGLAWIAAFACVAFFGACGWLARRPSVIAFGIGIAVFALDTLIFLMASDWIGLGFHALALYFLWSGFSAARAMRKAT
jgi:hypothetical protein